MRLWKTLVAAGLVALTGPVHAQEFPSGPVRIIVPFEAGDAIDGTARLLADIMADEFGSPVIVQNIPGGGGAAGTAEALRSPADGQTLLMASTGALTARPILSTSGYQTSDFKPIANLVDQPIGLAVAASSPYQTLGELVEAAKAETLSYSTPAPGSTQHVSMADFASKNGLTLNHVGGQGGRGAITKALTGEVDFAFVGASNYIGLAEGGQLRILGVASPERLAFLSDAPTFKEAGFDFNASVWFGLVVPQQTPEGPTEALRETVEKVAQSGKAAELYQKLNFEPNYMAADAFQTRIDESVEQNRRILTALGLVQ